MIKKKVNLGQYRSATRKGGIAICSCLKYGINYNQLHIILNVLETEEGINKTRHSWKGSFESQDLDRSKRSLRTISRNNIKF